MDCLAAREVMAVVLDEGREAASSDRLTEHLATCPNCSPDWAREKLIDVLLRRVDLVDPPGSFYEKTMLRVHAHRRPVTVPELSLADAGVVFAAVAALSLLGTAWLQRSGFDFIADPRVLLHGVRSLVEALPPLPTGAAPLAVKASMAALIAVLWSAAILIPRRPLSLRAR